MKFNTLVDVQHSLWLDALKGDGEDVAPLLLLGPPGIGKTTACKAVADRMTAFIRAAKPDARAAEFLALDLTSMMPEDLGGVPIPGDMQLTGIGPEGKEVTETIKVTRFAVQEVLAPFCRPGAYGVLVLDDITQASPAVQVAARQLVLFRRVGAFQLAPGVQIVVTGNRREDKSGAGTLPAHFRNCCCIVSIEPDSEGWLEWYATKPRHSTSVASFIRWKGLTTLSQLPKDADEAGAFPTPRSWTKLGRMVDAIEHPVARDEVIFGCVGRPVGVEFIAYLNIRRDLVDPDKVLLDPKGALGANPRQILNTADKIYSMLAALGELAAEWRNDARDPERARRTPELLLVAAVHAAAGNNEYLSTAFHAYEDGGGSFDDLVQSIMVVAPRHPQVAKAMQSMDKVMSRARQ